MIIRFYTHSDKCALMFMQEKIGKFSDVQFDITYRPLTNGNITHAEGCNERPAKPKEKGTTGIDLLNAATDATGMEM